MSLSSLQTVINSIRHWYIPLIIGIVLVLVGFYVFATPAESYLTLSAIFSISFLFSGMLQVMFSFSNRETLDSWGWYLAAGILYTLFGLLLVTNPAISVVTLPFVVGFYLLSHSAGAVGWAMDLKKLGIDSWSTVAAIGVLGVIFSFILIWNPTFAGLSLVICTGLAFILSGAGAIMLSLFLKKIKDFPGKISDDLKARIDGIKKEYQQAVSKK